MVNRRSLGEGLSLTPDKRAFIEGSAQPDASSTPAIVNSVEGVTDRGVIDVNDTEKKPSDAPSSDRVEPLTGTSSHRARSRARTEKASNQDPVMLGMANLLIPLTTRLQPSTAVALKRAGLEQRLSGARPATVQEIVQIAVADWLEKHNYL